jgi:hypothetical protein
LAVSTTAANIATGDNTATKRTNRLAVARNTTIPTSRFHPTWRLGTAAYLFTRAGGCSTR